jgi:hypothetical protein
MGGTLSSLYCRRNLRVRGSEKPGNLLGQRLIGGEAGQLALPQIEIAPGQFVEITGRVVGFRGHTVIIDHRHGQSSRGQVFAGAKVALSHCGIGANLANVE